MIRVLKPAFGATARERLSKLLPAALLAFLSPANAMADVSVRDLQIIGRTIAFTAPPPNGDIVVGLAFDSNDNKGVQDAQTLASQVGAGIVEGRITIRVTMMRDGTASSPSQVNGILVLSQTKPLLDAAVAYARQSRIPTLSLDPACLRMDFCAVSVRSLPTVQIVIHRSMVKSLDVTFQQAFMMLVKEY